MMVRRTDGQDTKKVILSFMDYLFDQSPYLVFEKPNHSKTISLKRGYRSETRTTGDNRKKSLNWEFKLITPSQTEILNNVNMWVMKNGVSEIPTNTEEWSIVVHKYMDDFIQRYLITEQPQTSKDWNYSLGYRQSKDRTDSKVHFFMSFVQPSQIELQVLINNWFNSLSETD